MKSKRIAKIILTLLLSIYFISCKKYLDEKPTNTLVVPESIADLQALLDDAVNSMNINLTPAYGEASADDYFLLQSTFAGRPPHEQDMYRWIPTVYNYGNDWSKGYTVIYNSNYCLEMIEKIPVTSQNEVTWKNVKGSALFYRAFNFLNLTWNYAKAYDGNSSNTDLGIVLRLGSDFNVPSVRSTVTESYDRVISDVKECIAFLPDFPIHPYRPSKAAAYGLLARAYLSMRKYDEALNYANLCLQIKSELIDCKINDPTNFTSPPPLTGYPFKQFNKETIFYSEMTMSTTTTTISVARAKVDTLLYASYAANDIRKSAFFQAAGVTPWGTAVYSFRGSYAQGASHFTGIATDEMYLTRAECYARKGDRTSALIDLNAVLVKRHAAGFSSVSANDATEALNKILIERRKELLFRGLRWMDIKRLNKEGANIILTRKIGSPTQIYTLLPNVNYYALPIPSDIINITGIPQNPI